MVSQQDRSDLIELIESVGELEPEAITAPSVFVKSLYKSTGKQEDLLSKTRPEDVALKNGKITLRFPKPVWVYEINLWIEKPNRTETERLAKHVSVTSIDVFGKTHSLALRVGERFVDTYPKFFATEICIQFTKISALGLFVPKCQKIDVIGLTDTEFGVFCKSVMKYINDSNEFASAKEESTKALNATLQAIQENDLAIEAGAEEIKVIESDLAVEREKLSLLQLDLTKAEAQLSIVAKNDSQLRQRIDENEQVNTALAQKIQTARGELEKLEGNKNIFMEEYAAYVEQGEKNIFSYFAIGALMVAIASICLWRLIASAASLAGDPGILKDISAFDLFLSRAPLALALAFVAALCLRIVGRLLSKIFDIHQERLLLSKLSILAKDNSFASAEGLAISPDLVYSQRISLKMELLKEFLAGNYRSAQAKESVLRERFIEFLQRNRKAERDDVEPDLNEPESR
ncbi:hypothetical protein J3Q00_11305 [Pseudomonas sp. D2-3]